jgi:hypothetical protein
MAKKKTRKKKVVRRRPAPVAPVEAAPAPKPKPSPKPKERKRYGSFYEAWANVKELRECCQRHGSPRLGLKGDELQRAHRLIKEYQNG